MNERFWQSVDKGADCWMWTGAKGSGGYGTIFGDGRRHAAHRLAYEMAYGPIPAGAIICHRCDTPACVRPDHLYAGTAATNADDRMRRVAREVHMPKRIARLIRRVTFEECGEFDELYRLLQETRAAPCASMREGYPAIAAAQQRLIDRMKEVRK